MVLQEGKRHDVARLLALAEANDEWGLARGRLDHEPHVGQGDARRDRRDPVLARVEGGTGRKNFLPRVQGQGRALKGVGVHICTRGRKKNADVITDSCSCTHRSIWKCVCHYAHQKAGWLLLKNINLSISEKCRFPKKKFSFPKPNQTKVHIFQKKPSCLFREHNAIFPKKKKDASQEGFIFAHGGGKKVQTHHRQLQLHVVAFGSRGQTWVQDWEGCVVTFGEGLVLGTR